ncbi:MAG TPA: hypothetical protein VN417_05370 [Candidatus Cryosericum sp.]|nr:hypothetical protein [Candidatus Cryosericum sp.]
MILDYGTTKSAIKTLIARITAITAIAMKNEKYHAWWAFRFLRTENKPENNRTARDQP